MKKNLLVIIAGAAALISYLFLPLVSFMGQSISVIDLLDMGADFGFIDILPIIAGAALIIAGIIFNKKLALVFSIVGLVSLLAQLGSLTEKMGDIKSLGLSATDLLGSGFWITTVVFAIGIFFSSIMNRE